MQQLLGLAALASLAAPLAAQGFSNAVIRNNEPYFVTATATSAATGQNYNWDPVNPGEYSRGTLAAPVGVPANTWSWRILPREINYRSGNRQVSGFVHDLRLSAETATSWTGVYEPEVQLMATVPRPSVAGALNPDWNKVLVSIGENPVPPLGTQQVTVTRALANPINVPSDPSNPQGSDHLALALKFRGGESKWINGAQGFVGSWMDGPTPSTTTGFYYPTSRVTAHSTDPRFVLWATYMEAEPTINVYSDWGQRRFPPQPTPLLGHSIGTYYSDIATASGNLGLSVRAANYPGGFAAVLFNFGPWIPVAFPLFGQTVELNVADPNLGLFGGIPGVGLLQLDPNGAADGFSIPIPANAAFTGTSMGFEALVFDPLLTIQASTGSAFVQN